METKLYNEIFFAVKKNIEGEKYISEATYTSNLNDVVDSEHGFFRFKIEPTNSFPEAVYQGTEALKAYKTICYKNGISFF